MEERMKGDLPVIVVAMGDPSGISPELTARILAEGDLRASARYVVFGDSRLLQQGIADSGVDPQVRMVRDGEALPLGERPVFVDLGNHDPADLQRGKATLAGGKAATENFRRALQFAAAGQADAVVFTPFNKAAMRFAYPGYDDEIRFVRDAIGFEGPASEFNILGKLWNARVTSHIPLSEVAANITQERILRALSLADANLRLAGFEPPRIAVAGINPHAGDGGNFGRDEIDTIEPAVKAAKAKGFTVEGPFPSDTVFLRARNGDFDAVLTMYHDQGQIAMKLIGFDSGVTLIGGFPFPICTPAHGTAYEIAGKGIANLGATRAALALAIKMAQDGKARAKTAA
ncbi:MAG: 4-hydroxythreonine-4-phosphate dehydrogenase PdxA [Bosea sp. (in: a-proteobacteria)]|uniref:4-hydroxythreonine-4-phosphate dehydrogenase PdxA n=1 Tax=Bosea sp. (in: a-proteobacteria) TaxID=1871050 RepID=UPI002733C6EE|nr:4-hydroxythreonine-4-phosphate dehydrogenase PdxA [Bosea sp. (in: a-proteobacteria)]MDP3254848.1 4-hydroxythreonine-4-phosphate dehydrogenase PdxA [Bosea sp. (in: a-proteobacteria)]MDP3318949.1 4-hydroxythreonine-4-phosphate dehydrogenase PdxA [Bosea sp. (in: a-proteobacteria)]